MRIETQNTEQPILTDEEVWLRAYLVGFQCDEITSREQCEGFANAVLGVFKERFRKND